MSPIFVGTSGWAYKEWRGVFYPEDLPEKDFLGFYSSRMTSLEVNYTFRRRLLPSTAQKWISQTPVDFLFSFKAPQAITHYKRLRVEMIQEPLAGFIDTLKPFRKAGKLGALLFQVPHNLAIDLPLLQAFLGSLPADHHCVIEFRHASWLRDEVYESLQNHQVALCHTEGTKELSTPDTPTTDFLYWRLRREQYSPAHLKKAAERLRAATGPSYVYFKHEDSATGPKFATQLLKLAGTSSVTPWRAINVQ